MWSSGINVWLRPIRFFFSGIAWFSLWTGCTVSQQNWSGQVNGFNEQAWLPFCGNTCFRQRFWVSVWQGHSLPLEGGDGEELKESYSCDHKLHIHSFTVWNDLSFCFWQDQNSFFFFFWTQKTNPQNKNDYEKKVATEARPHKRMF